MANKIELSIDSFGTEENTNEFVAWLRARGHDARVGRSTGNYVDGRWTSHDEEADKILDTLWNEFCDGNSRPEEFVLRLNQAGQQPIREFVSARCKQGVNADAFFADAEARYSEDGADASVEFRSQYTASGRPELLDLQAAWFGV